MSGLMIASGVLALGSLVGPVGVGVVAAVTAALASSADRRQNEIGVKWFGVIFSFAFPLAALRWGESSFLIMMAMVVIASAGLFISRGLREHAMVGYSFLLIRVLTGGFLLSYLPIIRGLESGRELLWSFLLILLTAHFVKRFCQPRFVHEAQRWIPMIAAASAAALIATACLVFLPDAFSVLTMVILGISVAGAAMLGEQLESMLGEEGTESRAAWRGLGPLLFAAPAFFYTFRLYLT